MSLLPATSCKEGVQQYCNYGYDKNLYSSYEDCMSKKMQECDGGSSTGGGGGIPAEESIPSNGCPDGSGSLGLGALGILLKPRCWSNKGKWTAIIGGTLVLYYILHKTGSLK